MRNTACTALTWMSSQSRRPATNFAISLKQPAVAAEGLWVQPEVQATGSRRVRGQPSRHERRRKERRRRYLHLAKLAVASVTLALSAVLAVSVVTLHLGMRAVLTGSMRPDYGPGAVLLTKRVPVATIKPGMIVLFVPPGEHSDYAHRITSVTGPQNAPIITTKGDANKGVDPWHAKLVTPYVNQVIGSLPGVGRVIVAIRGTGQIVLAALGGIVAAWAGSKWVFSPQRTSRRRTPAGTT
jgi:signal peptidase